MVYKIRKSMPSKIVYFAFILLMAFMLVIGFPSTEAKAFVPLVIAGVTIAPEVVAAGATLLIATGLTFSSSSDAQHAFANMYATGTTNMRNKFLALKSGINIISDELWNFTKTWVDSKFNTGSQTIDSSYHETQIGSTSYSYSVDANVVFPLSDTFTTPVDMYYQTYDSTLGSWVTVTVATGSTIYLDRIPYAGDLYQQRIYVNGVAISDNNGSRSGWVTCYDSYIDKLASYSFFIMRESGYYYLMERTHIIDNGLVVPKSYKVMKIGTATDQVYYDQINVTGESIVDQSNYDFKTATGTRTIDAPATVDDVAGKTYTDVQNPTVTEPTTAPTTAPELSETTKTWWQTTLGSVVTPVTNVLQGMSGTLADIKQAILDGLLAAVTPIVNAVTAVRDAVIADTATVAEPDLTPNYKNYNLPDLFLLLILVIIAFIRLVLRALVWIVELYGLSPSSDMLNTDIVSGINFLKNQQLPYFNMSFWSLVNILFTVLFGLALVTVGKKFILSLGSSGGLLSSLYQKVNGQGRS